MNRRKTVFSPSNGIGLLPWGRLREKERTRRRGFKEPPQGYARIKGPWEKR